MSVSQVAEQLLSDPENAARMQRLSDAAQRVAELQVERVAPCPAARLHHTSLLRGTHTESLPVRQQINHPPPRHDSLQAESDRLATAIAKEQAASAASSALRQKEAEAEAAALIADAEVQAAAKLLQAAELQAAAAEAAKRKWVGDINEVGFGSFLLLHRQKTLS
jgi:hypothetical protein